VDDREVRAHPDVIFLSEAFTRPKMMKRLAKVGFSAAVLHLLHLAQHQAGADEYLTELAGRMPDSSGRISSSTRRTSIPILLQTSGRPASDTRAIAGGDPVAGLGHLQRLRDLRGAPLPGKEEYLDSEKYQLAPGTSTGRATSRTTSAS
jgi:starch synthase (maltosyl-transferring)